ncbi:MAG: glycosyltransferase [Candidatus Portnoybacteria bacterium]|nr:glycosyltransferase [Candidatus Portnoybacteria bacterium]
MKLALVHDFLMYWGGAERVLHGLHAIFPRAPIFTLFFNEGFTKKFFPRANIHPSFLQKFPLPHRFLLPFLPTAAESLILDDYDVVISSGTFSKGIIVRPKTLHIHYCHTPPRFLWEESREYIEHNVPFGLRSCASLMLHWLRIWDRQAGEQRVDTFIANSKWTQARIKEIYGRDSRVIYPFADLRLTTYDKRRNISNTKYQILNTKYFLVVSRLQRYKNLELPIKVFTKLNLPLYIVGEGPDKKRLQRIAGDTVKFFGFADEKELSSLYKNARALIHPSVEDFGLTPIEAMAQGTPALAYRKGGAEETIIESKTGEFFDELNEKSLHNGLQKLLANEGKYSKKEIIKHVQKFSFERFQKNILKTVREEFSN